MNKKLPGVFANKISGAVAHNKDVAYGIEEVKSTVKEEKKETNNNLNINQKINAIFNSPRYVYKADVKIAMKDQTIERKIIGRNSIHLITMDNELIPISEILDISFLE